MTLKLNLLCAGAAQGLVGSLSPRWREAGGGEIVGRFGAVGAMKEALLAGEACDVFVSTDTMIGELAAAGRLRGSTRAPLGRVYTGVAVRRGDPHPEVSTPEALREALLAADAVYFPDALKSTAGIHFAGVLRALGIAGVLAGRLRDFPNGATAMREMAGCDAARPLGCTQVSEILYTEGVELVARLPSRFELATIYTAAVCTGAADAAQAERFVAMLAADDGRALRAAAGFDTEEGR